MARVSIRSDILVIVLNEIFVEENINLAVQIQLELEPQSQTKPYLQFYREILQCMSCLRDAPVPPPTPSSILAHNPQNKLPFLPPGRNNKLAATKHHQNLPKRKFCVKRKLALVTGYWWFGGAEGAGGELCDN